jgi:CRISPR associated protein Cas1
VQAIRLAEAQAAYAYWSCWHTIPVTFPTKDLPRVPEHWRAFGARLSPLTNSPRLSVNPPNAMLNCLYAVLESEARLAAVALGLDPGLGIMHADMPVRDSLACDLMESVRPLVDAYVLDWITRQPLRREWFFEERNGNCRLMGSFAKRLSETAPTWARAVAPIAEHVAKALWSARTGIRPPTLLTQAHRRAARGAPLPTIPTPLRLRVSVVSAAARLETDTQCVGSAMRPGEPTECGDSPRRVESPRSVQKHRRAAPRHNVATGGRNSRGSRLINLRG